MCRTGDETWKRMTKFWGKLFLINFAMGVVTGIVQEFQFGMNWSEYSRFVGDIFGAPLAIEALLAFFLESTFLGIWIFGWERLSKRRAPAGDLAGRHRLEHLRLLDPDRQLLHAGAGRLRHPQRPGRDGRLPRAADPIRTSGCNSRTSCSPASPRPAFFVLGIARLCAALSRASRRATRRSFAAAPFQIGRSFGRRSIARRCLGAVLVGHSQAQHMVRAQPMKMAVGRGAVGQRRSRPPCRSSPSAT